MPTAWDILQMRTTHSPMEAIAMRVTLNHAIAEAQAGCRVTLRVKHPMFIAERLEELSADPDVLGRIELESP